MEKMRTGTSNSHQRISPDSIKNYLIRLPIIKKQKIIGKILKNLDKKIEINSEINKNLEEIAKNIFKNWFINFEPFKQSQFKSSDLGPIPVNWKVMRIKDFTNDIKNGGTPRRDNNEYWEDGTIPWIKTKEINNSIIIESEEKITKEGLKNSSAKLLPLNTILMALYGKGTAGRISLLKIEATTNQACCAMICESYEKAIYLYLFLLANQSSIEILANGSVQQNLSKDVLENLNIIVPSDEIIDDIMFNKIFEMIENNLRENKQLENLRDVILPKIMSGKIDVSNVEI
jgi:type I restriction enzyme S subunit